MAKYILIISIFIILILFTRIEQTHQPTYVDVIKNKEHIPLISVLIKESVDEAIVSIDQSFVILSENKNLMRDVKTGISRGRIGVDRSTGELYIKVNGQQPDYLKVNYCKMVIPEGVVASLGKGHYLGSIIVYVNKKNQLNVVNELDLETYLLGVLPGETLSSFGLEAIKAQAVASRSYALTERMLRLNKRWHLRSTTRSQVYKGLVRVHSKFKKAVAETRGLVLLDDEKVIRSYFASMCGGATADLNSLSWEKKAGSIMMARECPWCKKVKPNKYYWKAKFTINEISQALKRSGYRFKTLKTLKVKKTDKFTRVLKLEVTCSDKKFIVDANLFRTNILRATGKLRSRMFVMTKVGSSYSFKGRGWGHGVGLCQYGSQGLAKANWGFRKILGYYYLGAKISKFYE